MSQFRIDRLDLSDTKRALLSAWLRERGIHKGAAPGLTIPRRTDDGPIPLSFAQERLWFFAQLDPKDTSYNLTAAVRLRGDLQVVALQKSVSEIIRRHEVLRTTFTAVA